MNPRIAITGLGGVCSLGRGVAAILSALQQGRSGLSKLSRFTLEKLPAPLVGEAPALDGPTDLPTTHQLARCAAEEAFRDADLFAIDPTRIAVVLGTTTGGIGASESWYLAHLAGKKPVALPLRHHPASTVGRTVAEALGTKGPRLTIATACSSGANAILCGVDLLRSGAADVVLAGGADALCRLTVLGFSSLRLLSPTPCRPFDASRDGLNLGEAGAFLVLERAEDARARGARPHAYLAGGAQSCDAHHLTAPSPDGQAVVFALNRALAEGKIESSEVRYINAHGTATPANDRAEALALSRVFGSTMPPVSSSKSFLGHTLGAAGAIEALITVLAVREGLLPATLNTKEPEDGAPPDLVLAHPRNADLPFALSSSFGFGGNNAVLLFRRDLE